MFFELMIVRFCYFSKDKWKSMGIGQIGISHYNDENSPRTTGRQYPFSSTRFRSPKASRTQGSCARENI